ncbi:uncharacterized protein C8Q71DRAFT_730139 [Rhodofomes roseus]|uniref:Uncharacterized protein n=1 Tax=Rhodofomes roseus TaxID=34475 RepID=A0ABQ8KY56_9APHY|nr:uncharacterized protein C8Q71DRAFT_730139 [Rhodofomes roseus]KAH9843820.1 hypothetical protein C8Q71DRAFT_730139 [Rhodofomes roseus]
MISRECSALRRVYQGFPTETIGWLCVARLLWIFAANTLIAQCNAKIEVHSMGNSACGKSMTTPAGEPCGAVLHATLAGRQRDSRHAERRMRESTIKNRLEPACRLYSNISLVVSCCVLAVARSTLLYLVLLYAITSVRSSLRTTTVSPVRLIASFELAPHGYSLVLSYLVASQKRGRDQVVICNCWPATGQTKLKVIVHTQSDAHLSAQNLVRTTSVSSTVVGSGTGHRLHKTVVTAHYYDTPAMYPNLPRANSSSNSSARTAPPPYSPGQAPSNGQHETSPLNVVFPGYGARTEPCSTSTSKTPFKLSSVLIAMTYIALFGVISIQALHLAKYPPTRAELAELKQEWDLELTAHKQMQDYDKWAQDRLAFERERDQWLVARREYLIDQDNWEQQRQSYEDDTESWRRAQEDYNLTKTFWDSEREAWELERKRWAREQEKRDKEWKADADKHRRGEGNALGVTWTGIESHHCVAYGTREYTARIAFDAAQACKQMPLTVNGALFSSPQECTQDEDSFVSRWHIDVGEASCKVYWGDLSNKGCHGQGSSKRRYEARLWGAGEWEWIHMCRSTPTDIHGQHFKSPTECEDRGPFYGMFGIWDVDDDTCA